MPGMYLNFPFDQELFVRAWGEAPDPVKTALLNSGVLVDDPLISGQLEKDGNLFTIPFYNILEGDPVNYNGATDITSTETTGDSQTGVAYGRAKGFTARNFVAELSGSDPFGHIVSSVARYWDKYRQKLIIQMLDGLFAIANDANWAKHTINLADGTLEAPHKIEATTLGEAATDVLGDNKDKFALAIMHSKVANTLEKLEVLEYWKYKDGNGIQRPMKIGSANGYTVIIDDSVPVVAATDPAAAQYTTYLLGEGVLRRGNGRLDIPAEIARDPAKNGGQDTLYTRIREAIHPNGFSFKVPGSGWTESPTDAQLAAKANWVRKFDDKAIPMAKIITQG